MISSSSRDGVPVLRIANDILSVEIAPDVGGRVTSLVHRPSGRECLWRNPGLTLARCAPGAAYDPNFYGGMDEVLPGDVPETIDGIDCPDHGELWTLPLGAEADGGGVTLGGRLPRCGLDYRRRVRLEGNRLVCDYRLANPGGAERRFMWKLHAALAARPGDRIACPAAVARAADPAWSRRKSPEPFAWPDAGGLDLSRVPEPDGTTEYLFLCDLAEGRIALEARDGVRITCGFDRAVFPCCVYFASHGALGGAFTAVLEPCTNFPVRVNEAAAGGLCARLKPGAALETTVIWTIEDQGRRML